MCHLVIRQRAQEMIVMILLLTERRTSKIAFKKESNHTLKEKDLNKIKKKQDGVAKIMLKCNGLFLLWLAITKQKFVRKI